jgi:iron complex outermembrane receptor protein
MYVGLRSRTSARRRQAPLICLMLTLFVGEPAVGAGDTVASTGDLKRLSVEELMNLEVTSVTKEPQKLLQAAAAIYVITRDQILRSGARSVPDMLRLAPNLQVAQITSSSFAVSARGFNGSAASKLLVLIDGRSVYTPYHSGVSWDVQDVLPEDVERIEVISGPGATLWGANAVNGVINIVTRRSSDTQGPMVDAGAGNLEQRGSVQYGGQIGAAGHYRAYADSFHFGHNLTADGMNAHDDWHKTQGGFRMDWAPPGDLVTLQGDFYGGSETEASPPDESVAGQNLVARWNHELGGDSGLQVQAYFDHLRFSLPGIATDELYTYDLDIQHSFSIGKRQNIVWGGGYRLQYDDFPTVLSATQLLTFIPKDRKLALGNIFVQDTIAINQTVKLILGAKAEDDPYTGWQALPNARLSWGLSDEQMIWAAASRAVRAASRLDRDLYEILGPLVVIRGGDFQPEKLTAYELGYRAQTTSDSSVSVSTFYNVYDDLRTAEYSPGGQLPVMFANLMEGETYGAEVWGTYQVRDGWRLDAGASWLRKNLRFKPGSAQIAGTAIAGDDPSYQASLSSTMFFARQGLFYLGLRQVGSLPDPASPAYTALDARLAWDLSPSLQLSLQGQNLIHSHHLEFGTAVAPLQLGATGVETGRSVFGRVTWGY